MTAGNKQSAISDKQVQELLAESKKTKLRRHEDWVQRLEEYFEQRKAMPFIWGENDCCLFACGAIRAMTGIDMAANLAGTYDSEMGALRALRKLGCSGVEALAEKFAAEYGLAAAGTGPLFAQRGDIVLCDSPPGPALSVVALDGRHVVGPGRESKGLVRAPLSQGTKAWRI